MRVSAARALTGLAIGGGLGLLLGLLTGSVRFFETLLDSTIQMVRNIPALAMIPLVILWFGIDESAKLFLIAVAVFFPIYLNTFHGIRNVDPGLIEMGRTYGLGRWGLYTQIILPGALSSILVGLRFSLGLMWVILIVAETISAQAGIGYLTMNAREFLQTDIVLVGIPHRFTPLILGHEPLLHPLFVLLNTTEPFHIIHVVLVQSLIAFDQCFNILLLNLASLLHQHIVVTFTFIHPLHDGLERFNAESSNRATS